MMITPVFLIPILPMSPYDKNFFIKKTPFFSILISILQYCSLMSMPKILFPYIVPQLSIN
jgi:hypothetical protein